jgi:hypothetical protein
MKIAGAGALFLGLGAFGISNLLNNIREASAQEQMQQMQLMLPEQVQHRLAITWIFVLFV